VKSVCVIPETRSVCTIVATWCFFNGAAKRHLINALQQKVTVDSAQQIDLFLAEELGSRWTPRRIYQLANKGAFPIWNEPGVGLIAPQTFAPKPPYASKWPSGDLPHDVDP
jgi:hypothetical protein